MLTLLVNSFPFPFSFCFSPLDHRYIKLSIHRNHNKQDDCLLTLTQVGTQPGQCAFGFVEDTPAGRTPVTSFTASDIPTTISWRYSNNCDNLM